MVLGLIAICIIWGTTWLAIKVGLESIPPFLAAGARFLLASAVLGIIIKVRKVRLPVEPEFIRLTLLLGFMAFGIPFALVYWGQQHIETGLSSILFASFPLWVAVFSHFRLETEQVSITKWIGTISGFIGILIIFWSDFAFQSKFVILGMGAILLSAFLQAFVTVSTKKHGKEYPAMAFTFVGMLIGGICMMILSLLVEDFSTVRIDQNAIFSTLYLSLFGSVITFVTYFWLLKRVEAVLLSMTAFVTPILAVITGAFVLSERLPAEIFAGSALVLSGILIANIQEIRKLLERGRAFIQD